MKQLVSFYSDMKSDLIIAYYFNTHGEIIRWNDYNDKWTQVSTNEYSDEMQASDPLHIKQVRLFDLLMAGQTLYLSNDLEDRDIKKLRRFFVEAMFS